MRPEIQAATTKQEPQTLPLFYYSVERHPHRNATNPPATARNDHETQQHYVRKIVLKPARKFANLSLQPSMISKR